MNMQKIVTIRSSQGNLNENLREYTRSGWKIVSTTKGSEWTRVLNTYKWTVVLEKEEPAKQKPAESSSSVTEELEKAHKLYESNAITLEEYNKLKEKILSK